MAHLKLSKPNGPQWALIAATLLLAIVGYRLFSQFDGYKYLSDANVDDILLAKLWTLG